MNIAEKLKMGIGSNGRENVFILKSPCGNLFIQARPNNGTIIDEIVAHLRTTPHPNERKPSVSLIYWANSQLYIPVKAAYIENNVPHSESEAILGVIKSIGTMREAEVNTTIRVRNVYTCRNLLRYLIGTKAVVNIAVSKENVEGLLSTLHLEDRIMIVE